jgi:hypothetical protein
MNTLIAKIGSPPTDKTTSRIGGNIPSFFIDKIKQIENLDFYACLQNPENRNKYLSIFVPKKYSDMVENNIYPNCSIKVIAHAFSAESKNENHTIKQIKKSSITNYKEAAVRATNFITVAEKPVLIQEEDHYYNKLTKDNYRFYLQIDEDHYPGDLLTGNYIFGYGALYLYRKNLTDEIISGFWQYS